jgi:hypothetical protein
MRCPSCLAHCLDTDTRCPSCRREFVSPSETADAKPSMAQRFGMIFGVLGAGIATAAPAAPGIDLGRAAMAGLGAVAGGTFGMLVGLAIDRIRKKPDPELEPASPFPSARPTTRK